MENINNFTERLRSKEVLIGTLVSLPSPEVCELLANVGYDWLFIDSMLSIHVFKYVMHM